jgi:hypothetical protein
MQISNCPDREGRLRYDYAGQQHVPVPTAIESLYRYPFSKEFLKCTAKEATSPLACQIALDMLALKRPLRSTTERSIAVSIPGKSTHLRYMDCAVENQTALGAGNRD